MRKLLIVFGILIFLDIFYFSYVNLGQIVVAKYPPLFQYQWPVGLGYLIMALYGALGAFLLTYYSLLNIKDKLKKQSRSTEKADIIAEESSDRVKVLEAKIQTLETALKEALSRK